LVLQFTAVLSKGPAGSALGGGAAAGDRSFRSGVVHMP
jgi:hypothetical protein